MGIQYLEALKALGASPSTKFVLPLELTGLLQGVSGLASAAFTEGRLLPGVEPVTEAPSPNSSRS
jgi:hypothetical protein